MIDVMYGICNVMAFKISRYKYLIDNITLIKIDYKNWICSRMVRKTYKGSRTVPKSKNRATDIFRSNYESLIDL